MTDCNHCAGLSRSRLLHRAAAEAGRGLPSIEPGMPLPAGTGLSRRSFVAQSVGAMLAVYGSSRLGLSALEEGIAAAATGAAQPVLVSVFLEGGADALSVLSPQGDPLYQKLRPKLALSGGSVFAEDNRLHWHPAANAIAQLYGEKKVTVMPAVGYTNADQSHFTSRHYWEVGATSTDVRTGWLGRYLDRVGTMDNPLQGLSLDSSLAPALATSRVPVASIDGPDEYDFWSNRVWGEVETRMLAAIAALGAPGAAGGDPALAAAGGVAGQVDRLRNQLLPFHSIDGKPAYTSPVPYPTSKDSFPRRLAGLAAMIAAGLPMRVVSLTAPGEYDTHSNQAGALAEGLQDLGLAARVPRDLGAASPTALCTVGFGRRAQENGNAGTDHGAAGVGFLIGTRAKGTMVGEFPGLATGLDEDGNVKATSDFRGIYAGLLEQWLGTDAGAVIPDAASFARPALVK
jgi:uncharacterized protein (DUF1501 family)